MFEMRSIKKQNEVQAMPRPWFFSCPVCGHSTFRNEYDAHVQTHVDFWLKELSRRCDGCSDRADYVRLLLLPDDPLWRTAIANNLCHDAVAIESAIVFLADDEDERAALRRLLLPPPPGAPKRRLRRVA
jgi:hypothetical protein